MFRVSPVSPPPGLRHEQPKPPIHPLQLRLLSAIFGFTTNLVKANCCTQSISLSGYTPPAHIFDDPQQLHRWPTGPPISSPAPSPSAMNLWARQKFFFDFRLTSAFYESRAPTALDLLEYILTTRGDSLHEIPTPFYHFRHCAPKGLCTVCRGSVATERRQARAVVG